MALINYAIIYRFYRMKIYPLLLWTVNLVFIYTNETYNGYNFDFLTFFIKDSTIYYMNDLKNTAPVPWHFLAKMSILRIISFGMDKSWAFSNKISKS